MPSTAPALRPVRSPGPATAILTFPFQLFGVLCGSLLLSILIECLGVHFFWPSEGWHHAESMLHYEREQLSTDFRESLVFSDPASTAQRLVSTAYDRVFIRSGLSSKANTQNSSKSRSTSGNQGKGLAGLHDLLHAAYSQLDEYALAAGYTVLTFLVRLIVLTLTLPLFALGACVGLVDGLVRRDLRRFGVEHESGFVYHRARAAIVPIAALPWTIYLAYPVSVHPLFILLPSAIALSVAINITASTFKKYL
jgi:integrating conjugative element membrane protein (TIGR03747 family)